MKRCCCFIFGSFLLFAVFSFSGDFWQKEDYSSWNEKETQKILEDSPWATKTHVKQDLRNLKNTSRNEGGPGGGTGGFGGGVGGMGGGMGGMRGGMGGMRGGMGGGMGGYGGGMGGGTGVNYSDPPPITLRWYSALPVKEATARIKYKDKVKTSAEAAKSLDRKETGYILCVVGMPGQKQFYNAEDIKKNSMLKLSNHRSILPQEVVTTQEGNNVSLYLYFPKFKKDGTPLVTLKDGSIEVFVQAWMYDINKKFKLKNMVYHGKLEL